MGEWKQIGVIRTPYTDQAPRQPDEESAGEFRIVLDREFEEGLRGLDEFPYIMLFYLLDRPRHPVRMTVEPARTPGKRAGLFATRSPSRPNPIGFAVVRVRKIAGSEIVISCVDAFDGTPLLDIKPYFADLDGKAGRTM